MPALVLTCEKITLTSRHVEFMFPTKVAGGTRNVNSKINLLVAGMGEV